MFTLRFFATSFCAVLFAVMAAGCSSPARDAAAPTPAETAPAEPAESPEEVARGFMDASVDGDREAFLGYLTAKAREGFGEDDGPGGDEFDSYTVLGSSIDGNEAEVSLMTLSDGDEMPVTMKMREEDSAWRIYAMHIKMGEDFTMKINFETIDEMLQGMVEAMGESLGESFAQIFEVSPEDLEKQRAKYESIQAVSQAEYEASWTNATEYEGQPAMEALFELASSMGLAGLYFPVGEAEAVKAVVVQKQVAGLTKLAAIEQIANEAGLHALFPDPDVGSGGLLQGMAEALAEGMTEMLEQTGISAEDAGAEPATELPANTIRFAPGSRPYPIVFSGPFAIEVTGVQENAPNATGRLSLAVRAYGLGPALFALMEDDMNSTVFEAIENEQGGSIREDGVSYMGGGQSDGVSYLDSYSPDLRNLLRGVKSIALVKGTQQIRRPETVGEFVFDAIAEGQTVESKGMTATVKSTGQSVSIDIATPDGDATEMAAFGAASDADGNPINLQFETAMGWQADKLNYSMSLEQEPKSVRVKVISEMEIVVYPFEFSGIALQRSAEQPEQLEELSFEGFDSPVSMVYIEVIEPDESFAKVKVRVVNHSNKDIASIFANFVYLDGAGEEIDDFPSSITGGFVFRDGEAITEPVAAAGETKEMETTAFNMPSGTEAIRIEINQAEFSDGTKWESN